MAAWNSVLLALCAVIVIYEIYKFPRRDSRVLEFDYSPPLDTVEPENMTESGRVCAVLAVGPRLVDGVSALCTYQGACKPVMECGEHFGVAVALWFDPRFAANMDVIVAASDDAASQPPAVWPKTSSKWQMRVLVGFENPDSYPHWMHNLHSAASKDARQHHLAYGLVPEHNDFAINSIPPEADLYALQQVAWSFETRDFIACFISDSARKERNEYISALAKSLSTHNLQVHFYGRFMHNKDEPQGGDYSSRFGRKIAVLRKYRFTLAFENTRRPYYITEKAFNALQAGSLPVYWGSSNMADFMPERSFIDANSMTPQELANQLVWLNGNSTAYAMYFDWKQQPLPSVLINRSYESSHWTLCRACSYYMEKWPLRGVGRKAGWDPLLT